MLLIIKSGLKTIKDATIKMFWKFFEKQNNDYIKSTIIFKDEVKNYFIHKNLKDDAKWEYSQKF